jgi:hypothetical protein
LSIGRNAILAISLSVIEDQLDLGEWLPEWLSLAHGYNIEACEFLDWHEGSLRMILSCAEETEE